MSDLWHVHTVALRKVITEMVQFIVGNVREVVRQAIQYTLLCNVNKTLSYSSILYLANQKVGFN